VGEQSRLRAERRAERRAARDVLGRPTEILRELHHKIRCLTYEGPRRSWELMLEILGDATGVNCLNGGCLTSASEKVIHDLPNLESTISAYVESWDAELKMCGDAGRPVTDPVGAVLEESGGTNQAAGQYFTPMSLVRTINAVTVGGLEESSSERRTSLDSACGTGRFSLDLIVHHPSIVTFNVDIDLWMVRAAIINFRFAARYSHAVITTRSAPDDLFTAASVEKLRARGMTMPDAEDSGRLIVIGGRTWTLCADSLIVDLMCHDNWRYSWLWDPPPWQSTMKVAGFDGTYEEWRKARPPREIEERLARQPPSPELVDLNLDEAKMRAHMVRATKDVEMLMPTIDEPRSVLHGPVSMRGMPLLAGNESGVPLVRRRPP
jgi:hypothetical protein